MGTHQRWCGDVRGWRARPHREPLEIGPSEIRACGRVRRDDVYLLGGRVADITDQQCPTAAVEREAPRIAQAVGEDLRRGAATRVKAEHLAGARPVLAGARAGVQQPIGPELQLTAALLKRGRIEVEHASDRARAVPELVDPRPTGPIDVVCVEAAAPPIVRRERDRGERPIVSIEVAPSADFDTLKREFRDGEASGFWHYAEGCVSQAWIDA
jgi:hypothetical protein